MAAPEAGWALPRLRVDADGEWYDDGVQVTHHGVLASLRAGLRRDPGGYFIQTRVRIPVEVDDVPWVVRRLWRDGDALHVVLNDGTTEAIDPAGLRMGAGDVPYCVVKGGGFEARLDRAAAFQLLGLAHYDEATGRGVLIVGERAYELTRTVA